MDTLPRLAAKRFHSLLDETSFVEFGALVTAGAPAFNLNEPKTPSVGCP